MQALGRFSRAGGCLKSSKLIPAVGGRYASLFFIAGVDSEDNELIALEMIHRYVELLDKWFLNVCELDIIFGFQMAYTILDEVLIGGMSCHGHGGFRRGAHQILL